VTVGDSDMQSRRVVLADTTRSKARTPKGILLSNKVSWILVTCQSQCTLGQQFVFCGCSTYVVVLRTPNLYLSSWLTVA